jgi:serine/threonine-protein kinase
MREPEEKLVMAEAPLPSAEASAKSIDLSEVPVTGEEQSVELDKMASCVAGYLPKGAFAKSPDLSWVCTETDPSKGAEKLRVAVVATAPKGSVTQAMKVFARLGWYDMAAYAVVRAGCCEEPKPLSLPEPGQGCEPMAEALREIGKEVTAGKSYEDAFKRFTGAAHCELNLGRGAAFGHTQRPQPGEDSAFKELVESIAR